MSDIKEAEFWLEGARLLACSPEESREKFTVAAAMCVHAIIKANDEICFKFLGERATRHDHAPILFLKLIQANKIPAHMANFRKDILEPAIRLKASVDYKSASVSKTEAERWIRNAEKFISEVCRII